MAKKKSSFFGKLIKKFIFLGVLALVVAGGIWALEERPDISQYLDFGLTESPVQTFEVAYTPETIMQKHKQDLLRTSEHSFGEPYMQFSPLLLLHVKFTPNQKQTEEADCLWDQTTAEMILDTSTFETTHGFEDCVNSQATDEDFRLLHALSKRGGSLNKDTLAQELGVGNDVLTLQLNSLRKKHLIVQKLDTISLHFQSPTLQVAPRTLIAQNFVDKEIQKEAKISPNYSKSQIQKMAQDAFGADFAIRSSKEVYLPVVVIVVQNPDGSQLKTSFNGITGARLG